MSTMNTSDRAELAGLTIVWEYDPEPCLGCECGDDDCPCFAGTPHDILGCTVYDAAGYHRASLWGICAPDRGYISVVETDLIYEALAELDRETVRQLEHDFDGLVMRRGEDRG